MATRTEIINAIAPVFVNKDYALAFWQGGSAAFNRLDEWSDLDVVLVVKDGYEQQAMQTATELLEGTFGIEDKFEIDPPHWPGMVQTFFRLKNTSPFLLVDFSILRQSANEKFSEPEIHGNAVVVFDKQEVLKTQPVNLPELYSTLKVRIAKQQKRFAFFSTLVDKEVNRGKEVDAFIFYWSYSLSPLIEILRIKHSPYHWNWGMRYLKEDFTAPVYKQLQPLFFVKDMADLIAKNELCRSWFNNACKEVTNSLQ